MPPKRNCATSSNCSSVADAAAAKSFPPRASESPTDSTLTARAMAGVVAAKRARFSQLDVAADRTSLRFEKAGENSAPKSGPIIWSR